MKFTRDAFEAHFREYRKHLQREIGRFRDAILWADKLFDEEGERGLFNFLTFIEYNRDWMTVAELQRRRNYPDGHWMLTDRVPITFNSIEEDRRKIRGLAALKSIKLRRDKFHGHFDKDYFFDRKKLASEAPITWANLKEAGEVMGDILDGYSADFDGELHAWESMGIDDLTRLLHATRKGNSR